MKLQREKCRPSASEMKIGDRVMTPDGPGEIEAIEHPGHTRYGVRLDVPRYSYSPAYYFAFEVRIES